MALTLSQIYIYPIKSLGGISMETTLVQERGLQYDRRWMLVDENNQFLTQRTFAEMALLQVELTADGLRVQHKIKN
ncbi:MAG: MOSC domain-containing protein, partial [Cytophagales bacterium CG18_big_fil_WC_8_21_14_2_50_42_9]